MSQEEKKGLVLIVDDEAIVRESLREWLEMEGFSVLTAARGEDALQILQAQPSVNVGVFDIRMPGMDGVTLLEETMKSYPKMAVIMITAHATVENAVECMRKGAYDYVIKPFPPEKLTNLISNAVALQNLQKAHTQLQEQVASADIYLKRAERLMNLGIFAGQLFGSLRDFLNSLSQQWAATKKEGQIDSLPKPIKQLLDESARQSQIHLGDIEGALQVLKVIDSKREKLYLEEVVRNSLLLAKRKPEVVNARIEVKLAPSTPPIAGHIWALVQVCNNLILNAVTATKKGGMIEIATGVSADDRVYLQVRDTGSGMSEEDLQNLFTPFFCGWEEYEGIGLALVVSRNIVEAFQGKIEIDSEQGKGTTVRLLFPQIA